jgi:hypothetical protein
MNQQSSQRTSEEGNALIWQLALFHGTATLAGELWTVLLTL